MNKFWVIFHDADGRVIGGYVCEADTPAWALDTGLERLRTEGQDPRKVDMVIIDRA